MGEVPQAMAHYLEHVSEQVLIFLEMFCAPHFQDVSLAQWPALTSPALVQAHLNVDDQTLAALTRNRSKPGRCWRWR